MPQGKAPSTPAATATPPTEEYVPPPRPQVTGTISVGPEFVIGTPNVTTAGANITVKQPGHPLDGMQLQIPPNSYPNTRAFKVSSAPITGNTFKNVNPISPMITIDNGGGYSEELMQVKIPVKIPDGHFAMGFLYDSKKGTLEAMLLVEEDANSITVATRHFSSFLISLIADDSIPDEVDSGFQPGVDDWQFPNRGSYIADKGHCFGQCLTAMWYYSERRLQGSPPLYGLYDNNGNKPKTAALWQDDSLGYRLASMVQHDYETTKADEKLAKLSELISKYPPLTYKAFCYVISVTGEPQEVGIYRKGGGHSMIVYKVAGGALYIADPNYPGNMERRIVFQDGRFIPYESGANAAEIEAGNSRRYDQISFAAKTTSIDWGQVGKRWSDFDNKTIGNDKFPTYQLLYRDTDGKAKLLPDELVFNDQKIKLDIKIAGHYGGIDCYRAGEKWPFDNEFRRELKPGQNIIGVYVLGCTANCGSNYANWEYIDFKYVTITYGALAIDPPTLEGKPGFEYTFTATCPSPPAKARYEWAVDGTVKKTTGNVLVFKLGSKPSYTITCKLYDDTTNKELGTATATANVAKAPDKEEQISGDVRVIIPVGNAGWYDSRIGKASVHISLEVHDKVTAYDPKCEGGSKILCVWDWGDGTTSETPKMNADHQYSSLGTYKVSVKYMCPGGTKVYGQDSKTLVISDPYAEFK